MRKSWPLIVAGAVLLLLLFYLSSSGKKAPAIPPDPAHATLETDESCLSCHAPGKQASLKISHPPKEQCVVFFTEG